MLMHLRALVTALTLFSLPQKDLDPPTILLIVGLSLLYWIAARYWDRILPHLEAHPLLTGIDLCVSLTVLTFEGPNSPFFLSTVLASAVAGLLFHWRGMLLVATAQIVCYFAAIGYHTALNHVPSSYISSFQTLIGQPAYYLVIGVAGVMIRRLFDEQAAAEQARRNADIRAVAADERARLAREMHDSLAKTLRGIAMSAQALPVWVRKSPERAAEEAQRIASSAEIASREARELISDLRDDQVQQPLTTSLHQVLDRWAGTSGKDVHRELASDADLPLVARYEMISVLKEALTNIERHAGAEHVTVRLSDGPDGLTLSVADDGSGFQTPVEDPGWLDALARAGHYGVVGMYERAKRAGGDLTIKSSERGTTLTVVFTDRTTSPPDDSPGPGKRQHAEAG